MLSPPVPPSEKLTKGPVSFIILPIFFIKSLSITNDSSSVKLFNIFFDITLKPSLSIFFILLVFNRFNLSYLLNQTN